jgi:hypothetical protein
VGGEHAVAAGGPGGGDAAVEALAGLIAREGVAGVQDVLERLAGRVGVPRVFGEVIKFNAPRPQAMRKRWSAIIRSHVCVSEGERIDPRGLGTQLYKEEKKEKEKAPVSSAPPTCVQHRPIR